MDPDEHLRAALRHAPDAEVTPPAHVQAQILAAAHRAAQAGSPARPGAVRKPRRPGWLAAWSTWRLGGSGAFATLLMAGVLGLVWRNGTPPAVVTGEERPFPVANAPALNAAAEASDAMPAAAEPAQGVQETKPLAPQRVQAPATAPPAVQPRVPAREPAPPPPRQPMPTQPATRATDGGRAPAADAAKAAPDLHDTTSGSAATRPADPVTALPAPVPAQAQAPAPVVPQAPPPPEAATVTEAAPVTATPQAARLRTLPPAAAAKSLPADAAPAATQGLAMAERRAAISAAAPPAARGGGLGLALSQRQADTGMAVALPADVQWRVDGRLHTAPAGWLVQLQTAARAQGAWQPAPGATPQADEQEVSWSSGNQVLGRVWLGRSRVLWCTPENHCEQAALSPQAARGLLGRLVPQ